MSSDEPTQRLTRDELLALKFAAHRQLARWATGRHDAIHAVDAALTRG